MSKKSKDVTVVIPDNNIVKVVAVHPEAKIPERATEGSSGFDLVSVENKRIEPRQVVMVKTGLSMELPEGFEAQIRPRSGLAKNKGLTVANSPGTIDNDYRGEICVLLVNLTDTPQNIGFGDRIAQIVFQKLPEVYLQVVSDLEKTERNDGGFGSTGE